MELEDREMEYKNLSYGSALGLLAGAGAGVVLWVFTGNIFGISAGAGLGLLVGVVVGVLLDHRGDGRP